ncbi:MAG: type VI secretion system secreted protein VgrG [Phenylobacterium sp.]|jgi:type VI secretion system secreted protein VgrG
MSFRSNEEHLFFELSDPDLEFSVLRLRGHEGISETFEFQLELVSEDPEVTFDDVVGQSCVMTILSPNHTEGEEGYEDADEHERFIHGIVSHFEIGDEGSRFTTYHAVVVPKIWALKHRHNCRIFQQKSVIDIVSTLLDELGLAGDEYRVDCSGSYEPYVYCVQYRESELNFISRLLEAEGIFYYFEHTDEKHVMVFADDSTALSAIEGEDAIPAHNDAQGMVRNQHIYQFRYSESLTPGKVTLRDYNFEKPKLQLESEVEEEQYQDREVYDYPGWFADKGRGDTLSRLRMESATTYRKMAKGKSNVNRFVPGYSFNLADDIREQLNDEYLITRIEHVSAQSGPMEEDATTEGGHYNNRFTCIVAGNPFRPSQKTRIPVVEGSQTATVVGPVGEEIYTDEHGRVKVQFHWDRQGRSDENSSCWIRVSQLWAGGGYGGFFLPRIGQEVIIDFLEGNPDRPIVIGRVYHGINKPPYDLPAEKTKSTIKTNSSPQGGGFNELRFEDKKDEEQIFIHAQKNQDIRVKNSHFESVGNEHHLSVGTNRFEYVKENDHHMVDGDTLSKVKGNVNNVFEADVMQQTTGNENYKVDGDRIQQVGGTEHLKASQNINIESGQNFGVKAGQNVEVKGGMNINLTAGTTINLKAGGSFISIGPSGVSIKGAMVMINSGGSASAASPGTPAGVAQPDEAEQALAAATATAGQVEEVEDKSEPIRPSTYGPQAMALKHAARSGTPFCAQCEAANN